MKMYQSTSYLIAAETSKPLFDGMYISAENPTISIRTAPYKNSRLLLIGGNDNKTGEKIDLSTKYNFLENVAKDMYPDLKILHKWNTEDSISIDKIPYIGEFSNFLPNLFVATGFKKWGITFSNIAANIISDTILSKSNKYANLFLATRFKPLKNIDETKNMLVNSTKSLIVDKLIITDEKIKDIKKNDGAIIEINNKKVGVYKDNDGKLYKVKPVCSHLGCELSWNNLDKTWDCPCHGSRFDYTGRSIYSPGINDLEKL